MIGQALLFSKPLGLAGPLSHSREQETAWVDRISPRVLRDTVRGIDALLLAAAGLVASWVTDTSFDGAAAFGTLAGAGLGGGWMRARSAYSVRDLQSTTRQAGLVVLGVVPAAVTLCLAVLVTDGVAAAGPRLRWVSAWAASGALLLGVGRLALAWRLASLDRRGRLAERVAVLGCTPDAQRFARAASGGEAVELVGVFEAGPACAQLSPETPSAGSLEELIELSGRERIDVVVMGFDPPEVATVEALRALPGVAEVALLPRSVEALCTGRPVRRVGGWPLLLLDERPIKDWRRVGKRVFDGVGALLLLILLLPVLALVALAIRLDSPGPVLFRQKRLGYNSRVFEIFKFRTMNNAMRDPNAERLTVRNDPRVTRIGRWLRRTSIDELPQLLNVLRGEMSLVGPRPHPLGAKAANRPYAEVVEGYARRHRVLPGLTGWAQVNGWRGETETEEQILQRVRYDLDYIRRWSFRLDLKILLLTAWREFRSTKAF